jgi:drug/metabolite transporter (DMT)-like permease
MFFFLAIVAMVGYAVQSTFLTHFSRSLDGMSTALYRSMSLVVTMLPLLFFVEKYDWNKIWEVSGIIGFAGIVGALAVSFSFESANHLPVGIRSAFKNVFVMLLMVPLSAYFLGDTLAPALFLGMGVILIGASGLALHKNDFEHLDSGHFKTGIFFIFLSSICAVGTVIAAGKVSRIIDPLLMGYLWELSVAVSIIILIFFRWLITGYKYKKIPVWGPDGLAKIALISSPTVVATSAFIVALNMGSAPVLSAINTAGTLVVTVLGWFLYKEKLAKRDLFFMGIIVLGIIALKLVSQ